MSVNIKEMIYLRDNRIYFTPYLKQLENLKRN